MDNDPNISPVNPLPPVVIALALAIVGVEVALYLWKMGLLGGIAGIDHRTALIQDYAVSGSLVDWMIEMRRYPPEALLRFVAYPFIHASFTHLIFAVVILLAMGKFVGEIFRPWAVLLVFFAAAIGGAVVYGLIVDTRVPLIGAYPAVYGLIGAFTFLLWVRLAGTEVSQYRAFTLIGFLLVLKLVFGIFGGSGDDWIADVAGFVTGFSLSFVVSPGGWGHVLARLRQR